VCSCSTVCDLNTPPIPSAFPQPIMATSSINSLSARTAYGNAPLTAKQTKAVTLGRQPRLQVENNVKLVPVRQNTKQKLDCTQYKAGYIEYQPQEISFIGKNTRVIGATTEVGSVVDILVPVNTISSKHCELIGGTDSIQVRDLGSMNGTFVDGKAVTGTVTAMVGSVISIEMAKGLAYTVVLDAAFPLKTPKQETDESAVTDPASSSEAEAGAEAGAAPGAETGAEL